MFTDWEFWQWINAVLPQGSAGGTEGNHNMFSWFCHVFEVNTSRIRVCGLQNENQNLDCENINPVCDTITIIARNV